MKLTPNLGLKKPETTDVINPNDFNDNADILDTQLVNKVDKITGKQLSTEDYTPAEKTKLAGVQAGANAYTHPATHPASIIVEDSTHRFSTDVEKSNWNNAAEKGIPYAVASGSTAYTVSIPGISSLAEGLSIKVKFTNANITTPISLTINSLSSKVIKKSNGQDIPIGGIKAGQICHLVYTGSNFQLLGEGGEYGTAQAGDVLSGKTIGTESGLITGTMPNRGAVGNTITTQNGRFVIPAGYHNGSGVVEAIFQNLAAMYIKNGVTIGGVTGNLKTLSIANDRFNKPSSGGVVTRYLPFTPLIVIFSESGSGGGESYYIGEGLPWSAGARGGHHVTVDSSNVATFSWYEWSDSGSYLAIGQV